MNTYKYVYRHTSGKFIAQPTVNGKSVYLGIYDTEIQAYLAVREYNNQDKPPTLDQMIENNINMIAYFFELRKRLVTFDGDVEPINQAIFFHKCNVDKLEIIHDREELWN